MSSMLSAETLGQYQSHSTIANSIEILSTTLGQRLKLTAYGDRMIRVQAVNNGAAFTNPAYPMVDPSIEWSGSLAVQDIGTHLVLTTTNGALTLRVQKNPLRLEFISNGASVKQLQGIEWLNGRVDENIVMDSAERFVGLGHGTFGRVGSSLNLRGQTISRNYGTDTQAQAPLIVPFFISSAGYGIFLNSTLPNRFNFALSNQYQFGVAASNQMDYFFIVGPTPSDVLDRYTSLTGRPRLPQLAMFGLALSDKGEPGNNGASWWQSKVTAHRNLGLPLDHLVNDNRWRIGAGERCDSEFGWDSTRYPDPASYHNWLRQQGLVVTLDFNRCIAPRSANWSPTFNIDNTNLASLHAASHESSAPDFTNPAVANWWWKTIRDKGLNPVLDYPGDALWIDEFDALGGIPGQTLMANGKRWDETRNAWFLIIAKTLGDGWNQDIGANKRPFTWIRGGTAGGQRYATLWSGDTNSDYTEMRNQLRGLLAAGLSGFPYQGHDGGGFHTTSGYTSNLYRQWAMAFGSFTPFWRPHGDTAASRWPMDQANSSLVVADAKKYGDLRYALMPYTYTLAWQAHNSGIPMARAMLLEFPQNAEAWQFDQQFMWGPAVLVAPNASDNANVSLWLPPGKWYDYWSGEALTGGGTRSYPAPTGKLPLFIKAGAILPMTAPALSTKFMSRNLLDVHAYVGADGEFILYEDDGVSEQHQQGAQRFTTLSYSDSDGEIVVNPAVGDFTGAVTTRNYSFHWHGLSMPKCVSVDGVELAFKTSLQVAQTDGGIYWDSGARTLSAFSKQIHPVDDAVSAALEGNCALPPQNFSSNYPSVFLRGTNNAWGSSLMNLVGNNIWEINASFAAQGRFKFDVYANWTLNFGDNTRDGIADQGGSDILISNAGQYRIRFNEITRVYSFTPVTANQPPQANAGPDMTISVGQVAQFDGAASTDADGSIVSYNWSNGLSGVNPTLIYNTVGTFNVTLTVTDNMGAVATDTLVVTVTAPVNKPPLANAGADITVAVGATAQFDASASNDPDGTITGYSWSNGLNGVRPTLTYTLAGTYIVTLTVTDNSGATATDTLNVIVQPASNFISTYSTMYLRGTNNGWGTTAMQLVGNYTWEATATFAANGRFKFDVNANWNQGFGDNNRDGIAEQNGSDITVAQAGTYRITFNDQTRVYKAELVSGGFGSNFSQLYLRGTHNAWSTSSMLLVANNLWEITVTFSGSNNAFKFDVTGNWSQNYGDNNNDGIAEQNGSNIIINTGEGTYRVRFNDQTRSYSATKL